MEKVESRWAWERCQDATLQGECLCVWSCGDKDLLKPHSALFVLSNRNTHSDFHDVIAGKTTGLLQCHGGASFSCQNRTDSWLLQPSCGPRSCTVVPAVTKIKPSEVLKDLLQLLCIVWLKKRSGDCEVGGRCCPLMVDTSRTAGHASCETKEVLHGKNPTTVTAVQYQTLFYAIKGFQNVVSIRWNKNNSISRLQSKKNK